jgi:hypothetical protein
LLTRAPSAIISAVTFGTKVDVSMWERFKSKPLVMIAAVLAVVAVVLVVTGFIVAALTERLGQFSMELGEFLTRVLEAVAWPVVLLVIAWIFRDEIKERIRQLRSLTVGGNKAEFVDSTNEAARAADKLPEESPADDDDSQRHLPGWASVKLDQANQLVPNQPKESVVAAFEPIKSMILEGANRENVVVVPEAPLSQVLKHLPGEVGDEIVEAVSALERARKDALRVDGTIPQAAARSYVSAARRVAQDMAQRLPTT